MNSSRRKYFDKFGFFFKKYITNGNVFGARYFAYADEYYFNDKLVDVSFNVGINLGKFKSQISRRAEIEITIYIKDALKILDLLAQIITGKREFGEFSKKSEYRKNYNEVVIEVEGVLGIKKINDNLYKLGVFYRNIHTQEIMEYSVVEFDHYDMIEFHNMLKAFTQTSYNIITQLGIKYSTLNPDEIISKQDTLTKGIGTIVTNANIVEEDINLDNLSFELKVPSISIDIENEEVVKESDNIKVSYECQIESTNEQNTEEKQENITEEENVIEETSAEIHQDININQEVENTDNLLLNELQEELDEEDVDDSVYEEYQNKIKSLYNNDTESNENSQQESESNENIKISSDLLQISDKLKEIIKGLEQAGVIFEFIDNKYPIIKEIPNHVSEFFYTKLREFISIINNYGLTAVKIKPAFVLLLLNHKLKEFVTQNNLLNKGLYDLLQSLYLINKVKSDEPMFGKFNDEMIQERLLKYLDEHDQMIENKDIEKYKSLIDKLF